MPTKTQPFNVLMDPAQAKELKDLAEHLDITQSAVIRNLLRYAYQMHFTGKALCVSGQQCYAPHMHAPFTKPVLKREQEPCQEPAPEHQA